MTFFQLNKARNGLGGRHRRSVCPGVSRRACSMSEILVRHFRSLRPSSSPSVRLFPLLRFFSGSLKTDEVRLCSRANGRAARAKVRPSDGTRPTCCRNARKVTRRPYRLGRDGWRPEARDARYSRYSRVPYLRCVTPYRCAEECAHLRSPTPFPI